MGYVRRMEPAASSVEPTLARAMLYRSSRGMFQVQKLVADHVARAFNDNSPAHWKARPYLKARASGVFNAVNFSYKSGMVSLLLDCDAPFGRGFQVKFHAMHGAFGDFVTAIQKALYQVCTVLRKAQLVENVPEGLTPAHIMFGLRKDGSVTYLHLLDMNMAGDDSGDPVRELEYDLESDQRPEHEKIDVDDLL